MKTKYLILEWLGIIVFAISWAFLLTLVETGIKNWWLFGACTVLMIISGGGVANIQSNRHKFIDYDKL